jgi:hypothetical protein
MNATYIIETDNKQIKFENTALNFNKCLQIKRISEADKTWKGYYVLKMTITHYGLSEIHIKHRGAMVNER